MQIKSLEVMSDASGAPAIVEHDGFCFAFDMLGKLTCTKLYGEGTRGRRAKAKNMCASGYVMALALAGADAKWIARNAAMYAPEVAA